MPDFRLYRLAFVPALLAFVALMFSLQGVPSPLDPAISPAGFEPGRAAATARTIASAAPERPPGSAGEAAVADLVAERFGSIRAGTVSEQVASATVDGEERAVRNVLLTLPGDTATTIVVLAPRDATGGPGTASSAAATSVLVELAAALGVSGHAKTYVLASVAGGSAAARAVIAGLPDPDAVEAVLVLSQPGAADLEPPFVIATSSGPNRTAAQLVTTASHALDEQAGLDDSEPGAFTQFARLAFPSGVGLQAPLIDAGLDAIALSATGEPPLDPADAGAEELSRAVLGDFGRTAVAIVSAIDVAEEPLRHGPAAYLRVGDNLVPGWALALLALALLLPACLSAVDASARAIRRREPLGSALAWTGSRGVPALAGLVALYFLALVGLVPRPSFPFDPARFDIGFAAIVALVLIAAAMVGAGTAIAKRVQAVPTPAPALVAAAGVISCLAGLLAWLANPYLGLLVAPAVHAWVVAAAGARLGVTALAVAVALLPVALALATVAAALELGVQAPWTFLILIADGQIGFVAALALCLMTAALATAIGASRRRRHGVRTSAGPPDGRPKQRNWTKVR